jgi:translation elongation factor EF-Ts
VTGFSPGTLVSPVSVILHLHFALTRRQTIQAWEYSQKQWSFGIWGAMEIKQQTFSDGNKTTNIQPESVSSSAERIVADSQLAVRRFVADGQLAVQRFVADSQLAVQRFVADS